MDLLVTVVLTWAVILEILPAEGIVISNPIGLLTPLAVPQPWSVAPILVYPTVAILSKNRPVNPYDDGSFIFSVVKFVNHY